MKDLLSPSPFLSPLLMFSLMIPFICLGMQNLERRRREERRRRRRRGRKVI